MCEWGTLTAVPCPEWLTERNGRPLAIDSCIADVLQAAWGRGVRTLGSCCGHGHLPASLVLTGDVEQPELAASVMAEIDPDHRWVFAQWRLVDVP